jgi:hypothetical protein
MGFSRWLEVVLVPIGQELICGMADYKGRKVEDTPTVCNPVFTPRFITRILRSKIP